MQKLHTTVQLIKCSLAPSQLLHNAPRLINYFSKSVKRPGLEFFVWINRLIFRYHFVAERSTWLRPTVWLPDFTIRHSRRSLSKILGRICQFKSWKMVHLMNRDDQWLKLSVNMTGFRSTAHTHILALIKVQKLGLFTGETTTLRSKPSNFIESVIERI